MCHTSHLNGTPLRTRYSARSVASMSADKPWWLREGARRGGGGGAAAQREEQQTVGEGEREKSGSTFIILFRPCHT